MYSKYSFICAGVYADIDAETDADIADATDADADNDEDAIVFQRISK